MEEDISFAIAFGRRTVFLIAGLILFSFVLVAGFLLNIARTLDAESYEQTARYIAVSLDERSEWLNRNVINFANWGLAYTHLHLTVDTQWAFVDDNIGAMLTDDLGIEYGAVIDPEGREVYSVVREAMRTDDPVLSLRGGVDELVRITRALPFSEKSSAVGVLADENGAPMLAAASQITPGPDTSVQRDDREPSIMIFGNLLTGEKLEHLRTSLGLERLALVPVDPAAVPARDVFLRSIDGTIGYALDMTPPRPGSAMLAAVVPWFAAICFVIAVVVALLARQGLRIAALSRAAAADLERSHQVLERQALYDAVTGLPNRAMFDRHIRSLRVPPEQPFAVLFVDLDRFKAINDTHGHEAGDLALREVGRRISAAVRQDEFCARIGGDEFVVVASGRNETRLHELCKRLVRIADDEIVYRDVPLSVGVSVGVAIAGPTDGRVEDVIRRADAALYAAKSAGRSCYRWETA